MTNRLQGEDLPDVVMPSCPAVKMLRGQTALVTGATSGIGRGVAVELGKAGADVVVNYYSDEEAAAEVVDQIEREGSQACAHHADVSKEDQVLLRSWFGDARVSFARSRWRILGDRYRRRLLTRHPQRESGEGTGVRRPNDSAAPPRLLR